jgi:hypothetical protein
VGAADLLGHREAEQLLVPLGRPERLRRRRGTCASVSADGQTQHWFLVQDPEQFGRISGGKLLVSPRIKAMRGYWRSAGDLG